MEPELQNRLASVVGFLETSVQSASQFAVEQAPDVVQQLLRWEFFKSITCFTALVPVVVFGIYITIKARKCFWKGMEDDDQRFEATFIMTAVVAFITVGVPSGLLASNLDWLKIWIAPKLYLLEYASSLIK